MILDCVLTAVNNHPLYIEFIPLFIRTWRKLYPAVDVKILLIAEEIPEPYQEYQEHIILFPPIAGVSTAFTSQYIRLLYPALLNYNHGIMITDMDILPMNRTYYTKNIADLPEDKFIYLRNDCMYHGEIAMCYNVATARTWSEIFKITSVDDVRTRIKTRFDEINYVDGHGLSGWNTDQVDLYHTIMAWNAQSGKFVFLPDAQTGFRRLDRDRLSLDAQTEQDIASGLYSDYHCLRPYNQYAEMNERIFNLL